MRDGVPSIAHWDVGPQAASIKTHRIRCSAQKVGLDKIPRKKGGSEATEPGGIMHYPVNRPNWLTVADIVLAGVVAAIVITVVLGRASPATTFTCSGVQINPRDDLDAIVNGYATSIPDRRKRRAPL